MAQELCLWAQGGTTGLLTWLPGMVAIGLLFYVMLVRPQQREQQQRQSMLGQLKKDDHVVTHGGIYGVVTNIRREADEVTLRVDETNNTKLRVTLSSIARVTGTAPDADSTTS